MWANSIVIPANFFLQHREISDLYGLTQEVYLLLYLKIAGQRLMYPHELPLLQFFEIAG